MIYEKPLSKKSRYKLCYFREPWLLETWYNVLY